MEIFLRYFAPDIGAERWQLMWNLLNLFCGVASTAAVYAWYNHWNPGKKPFGSPNRNLKKQIPLLCLSVFTLYMMGLASEFLKNPDVEFPLYGPLYAVADFIDRFLNLRELYMVPVERLPLANMGVRVLGLYLLIRLAKAIFGCAQKMSEEFGKYLDENFESQKVEAFAKKAWEFLKKSLLVGGAGAGTAVVVTKEEYRDKVVEVLDWLYEALSKITLLTHLPENAATFTEMAEAFFVVVLSVLMVAVYLVLIVAVAAVARVLWDKREDILTKIKDWFKDVGYILVILGLVLFVVMFSILFASENESFQEAITYFIQNSPRTIFVLLQQTIMILAAIGIVVLMCITLIAVCMFGINFVRAWRLRIKIEKNDAEKARKLIERCSAVFLVGLAVLLMVFGYDPIRGWVIDRFADDGSGHGLWWVTIQICSGIAAIVAVFAAAVLGLYLVLYIASLFSRGFKSLNWNRVKALLAEKQGIPLSQQIEEYLLSLGKNIFQIFKGYQTEDQKNGAIYVAACFASLASLVNTAVGLHDFNIGWILSIAMSFAVQLAMLIFGMKAGQGIAENMVSNVKQVGANVYVAILRKLAACCCYLLGFLAALFGITILAQSDEVLWPTFARLAAKETFLPVLLIWCAVLIFGYGVIKQIIEMAVLWDSRKKAANPPTDEGVVLENPRRVPARYPLMAYLLFMIVSTGFAFTNLFGGYANQVQLHSRVYDQVYSETEKELELQDTALDVVEGFLDSKQKVLEELRKSYDALVKQDEENKEKLKENMEKETDYGEAHNAYQFYVNQTADFPAFYASLVSFINREYDLLGEDVTINAYEYSYYLYGTFRYKTVAFEIMPSGDEEKLTIGNIVDGFNSSTQKVISYVGNDPSKAPTTYWQQQLRPIEGANKYVLLNELFAVYENYAKEIMDCTGTQDETTEVPAEDENDENESTEGADKNSDGIDGYLTTIIKELDNMARLDGVRRNVAELYFDADPDAEKCVSMIELPRVIDLYLMPEGSAEEEGPVPSETTEPAAATAPTATTAPAGTIPTGGTTEPSETTVSEDIPEETEVPEEPEKDEQKYDKLVEYQELSDYVDRAIQVYNILHVAERTLSTAQDGGNDGATVPTQPSEPTDLTEAQEADAVYTVRTYRSYARGVANSNLQSSFDALTEGSMGMNGTEGVIDALYSAQMIAVFILIICALVDFMAFFSGLLLFQDVFLLDMKRDSKLAKLGYIGFDAVLAKYFMPTEYLGKRRNLQIAQIYYLLYCKDTNLDADLLDELDVDQGAFMVMHKRTLDYLKGLGVCVDTPEFHGWLDSFSKKNGIDFEDILREHSDIPGQTRF